MATAIRGLIEVGGEFKGTATELLAKIALFAPESIRRQREWPTNATVLSGVVRRVAPALRATGIEVDLDKTSGPGSKKVWTLRRQVSQPPEQQHVPGEAETDVRAARAARAADASGALALTRPQAVGRQTSDSGETLDAPSDAEGKRGISDKPRPASGASGASGASDVASAAPATTEAGVAAQASVPEAEKPEDRPSVAGVADFADFVDTLIDPGLKASPEVPRWHFVRDLRPQVEHDMPPGRADSDEGDEYLGAKFGLTRDEAFWVIVLGELVCWRRVTRRLRDGTRVEVLEPLAKDGR